MTFDHPVAFRTWDHDEREAIARVIASDRFTMGPEVEAFEAEFAAYHGMQQAIFVNSGSSANLLAVASLFLKQDRPLGRNQAAVVPAIAWATTFAPLVQYGLELAVVDVDQTWNGASDQRLHGTSYGFPIRLLVTVPVLGNPCSPEELPDDVYHIEDACESAGASIGGKRVGTSGILNTHSTFWSHQISAIEGGVITTNDSELSQICRMLRDHGATRSVMKAARFCDEYDFRLFGYNVRGLEMHAAIARCQLRKLDDLAKWRRANYDHFIMATEGLPLRHPLMQGEPSQFGFHFCCESEAAREKLVFALRSNGIDCRLPTGGSFRMHRYGARWAGQRTPNADAIHNTGIFLGNAGHDISDKIERAVKVIKETLHG